MSDIVESQAQTTDPNAQIPGDLPPGYTPDTTILPIANSAEVREATWEMLRENRGELGVVMAWFAGGAVVGLVGPFIIGRLTDAVSKGEGIGSVLWLTGILLAAVLIGALCKWFASYKSMKLGEGVFARLRERFLKDVTSLPLSTVERAGTGDLLSRTTNDIDALNFAVRFGVPQLMVAAVTTILTLTAAMITSPILGLSLLVSIPFMVPAARWYLRKAGPGYLREHAAYGRIDGTVSEAADGALTVEALGLGDQRVRRTKAAIREAFLAEKYTLWVRSVFFPIADVALWIPVILGLFWGGWLVSQGVVSPGAVVTVVLYAVAIVDPVYGFIMWLDELQFGAASLARIVGVRKVPADRTATDEEPVGSQISVKQTSFAYKAGRNVLHSVDLELVPGERLAIVGPSGAGKSTLGRLIAGINGPSEGSVTVGGVPLVNLPLDKLRKEVALVTQEHHVFVGSLGDNLRLGKESATDAEMVAALRDVGAESWFADMENGLATEIGSGGHQLTPSQAQELALARLVLADPHTLVLDEATSLIDPQAARTVEHSLAAVLEGRTVVAIAHRLHTAHDADRVAVVDGGRIIEIGSHDELLALNGSYASLWHSWRSE